MQNYNSSLEYENLIKRTKKLERQLKAFKYAWIISLVTVITAVWTSPADSESQADSLRLRRLAIVDEKGTERVVLGDSV